MVPITKTRCSDVLETSKGSFYHHFECGALLYDCKAIADVKNDMFATFEESEEIDILWCRNNISKVSLIGPLLNLLSPLL